MAKAKKNTVKNREDGKFMDKINMSWYHKAGTNKVTFCNSLNDIIEGSGQSYEFIDKITSFKKLTRNDKEVDSTRFILFVLPNENFVLATKWKEIK